jgi:hypothetical protein
MPPSTNIFAGTRTRLRPSGINVGGQIYAPFGVVERPGADILPPNDKGRFAVTKTVSDEYVFRVPPLRNIELTLLAEEEAKAVRLDKAQADDEAHKNSSVVSLPGRTLS